MGETREFLRRKGGGLPHLRVETWGTRFGGGFDEGIEGMAYAEPCGNEVAGLHPAEDPGDGAEIFDGALLLRAGVGALGGAGTDAGVFQLGDGCGLLEVGEGVGGFGDVFAVKGVAGGREGFKGLFPAWKQDAGEVGLPFIRLRSARMTSEYFQLSTSPCSVRRSAPLKLSSGWAKMARWVGPPPRPTVPPRPWKRRSLTPVSRATSWRARWALKISHVLVNMPPSLFESE